MRFLGFMGAVLKRTYRHRDDTYDNFKYLYFFFYQRVLMFNVFIPWPVHYTSYIVGYRNIKFGKLCSPGSSPFQYIQATNGIELGDNVQLAPGVQIISTDHDQNDYFKSIPVRPIKIGSNSWIGANAIILAGVHIGENVTIGAGSIVTRDIPSHAVAVGNPCRVIKTKVPVSS
jgi:acetyltransferase-like isoleucine patch superfamily enzyme